MKVRNLTADVLSLNDLIGANGLAPVVLAPTGTAGYEAVVYSVDAMKSVDLDTALTAVKVSLVDMTPEDEVIMGVVIPATSGDISGLSGNLAAETSARSGADAALSGALGAEASARSGADAAEASARSGADAAEASARSGADAAEASARSGADAALSGAIGAEASARSGADAALSGAIGNEAAKTEAYVVTVDTLGGTKAQAHTLGLAAAYAVAYSIAPKNHAGAFVEITKGNNTLTVAIVDNVGAAVDCSVNNESVDLILRKL